MQTNEQKARLRARLTALRDFKEGRACNPAAYAVAGSAYAKWYEDEFKMLIQKHEQEVK